MEIAGAGGVGWGLHSELQQVSAATRSVRFKVVAADARGKHLISAELKRLEQETRSLEEGKGG